MTADADNQGELAVLSQLLRDDHPGLWTRAELDGELEDMSPQKIDHALLRMKAAGAVILEGEQVQASRCTRYLDGLGVEALRAPSMGVTDVERAEICEAVWARARAIRSEAQAKRAAGGAPPGLQRYREAADMNVLARRLDQIGDRIDTR